MGWNSRGGIKTYSSISGHGFMIGAKTGKVIKWGLMKKKSVDPNEFLEFVHDINISWLPKDKLLKEELIKIKEKKYIFSNGSHAHIKNVTNQLGIDGLFDGAFDITDGDFVPKPHLEHYNKLKKKIVSKQKLNRFKN